MKNSISSILFLVILILTVGCTAGGEGSFEAAGSPQDGAVDKGFDPICDGCIYTLVKGEDVLCANTYKIYPPFFGPALVASVCARAGTTHESELGCFTLPGGPVYVINRNGAKAVIARGEE